MAETEELTGLAGLEADFGYQPLIEKPREDETYATTREAADAVAAKAPPPAPEERLVIIDPATGEEAAPNKTLTLDQATAIVTGAMERRQAITEFNQDSALQAAIDDERGRVAHAEYDWQGRPIDGLNDYFPQPKPEAPAKEQPEANAAAVQEPGQSAQSDAPAPDGLAPETRALLQNPQIRGAIEQSLVTYEQATYQAAEVAAASLYAAVPELQGMTTEQARGALAILQQQNPARAAAISQHLGHVGALLNANNQASQRRAMLVQYQLHQWREAQDAAFESDFKGVPEAERAALAKEARAALVEYGVSEQELARLWDSSILRSTAAQKILADAARYRMAKRGAFKSAAKAVPPVQKPGNAIAAPNRGLEKQIAELEGKPSLSIKEAAKLVSLKGQRRSAA